MKDIKDKLTGERKKAKFTVEPPKEMPTPKEPMGDIKPPSELFPETPKEPEEDPQTLSEASLKVTQASCRMFTNRIKAFDHKYGFEKIPDREQELQDFQLALVEYCIYKGIIFPPELFLGLAAIGVVAPYAVIAYAVATGRQLRPPGEIPDGNLPSEAPPGEVKK